jgi:hypothetical protein
MAAGLHGEIKQKPSSALIPAVRVPAIGQLESTHAS